MNLCTKYNVYIMFDGGGGGGGGGGGIICISCLMFLT